MTENTIDTMTRLKTPGRQLPEKELPSALQVKLYTRGKDILSRTERTAAIGYMYFAN